MIQTPEIVFGVICATLTCVLGLLYVRESMMRRAHR
jgi:hypothetical protein